MSNQVDWVGAAAGEPSAFRDIRNQRASIAEEKAERALRLGRLCMSIPPAIRSGGSVNLVREWQQARSAAAKVAGNKRSSVAELDAAINNMQRFFVEPGAIA